MSTTNPLILVKPLVGQYTFVYDSDRVSTLQNLGLSELALGQDPVALTDGATVTADWSVASVFTWTSAQTSTLAFTNTANGSIKVAITGGSASAITWPTVTWTSGHAPNNLANTAKLVVIFTKIGGTIYADDGSNYAASFATTTTSNASAISALQGGTTQVSAALTDGASVAVNWNTANVFTWTTAQTTTVTFSNTAEGVRTLVLTGGASSVITWPTISWNGGSAPAAVANTKFQIVKIRKVGAIFYGSLEAANP